MLVFVVVCEISVLIERVKDSDESGEWQALCCVLWRRAAEPGTVSTRAVGPRGDVWPAKQRAQGLDSHLIWRGRRQLRLAFYLVQSLVMSAENATWVSLKSAACHVQPSHPCRRSMRYSFHGDVLGMTVVGGTVARNTVLEQLAAQDEPGIVAVTSCGF